MAGGSRVRSRVRVRVRARLGSALFLDLQKLYVIAIARPEAGFMKPCALLKLDFLTSILNNKICMR